MSDQSIKLIVIGVIFLGSVVAAWKTKKPDLAWAGVAMGAVILYCTA